MRCILAVLAPLSLVSVGCARAQRPIEGASLSVASTGVRRAGIRSISDSDGVTTVSERGGQPCLANRPGVTPASTYLYFAVDPDRKGEVRAPLFVVAQYFDDSLGGVLTLNYDSAVGDSIDDKYRAAERRAGGWAMGTKQWRTAYFEMSRPRLANRENGGADFRFGGTRLFIRSLKITRVRPADWDKVNTMEKIDVKPLVRIGPGGQFIVGGFDPARKTDVPGQTEALEANMPTLKSLGVTSHEGYVRWNLCEPSEGTYDWSVYDAFAAVYKRHGMKWVPFLIVGSPYSLPDWYYKKPGSQGYVCLEHNQESDVQSLWNPVLKGHVSRFIKAFCEHYRDTGVIEGILLGVTGNYGEAIYIASGNDWTSDIHGHYHTHAGFWAGDKYAVESFRAWLVRKYGGNDRLRDAWGTKAPAIAAARPFLRPDAPNERAWLDMCDWYIGSMTEWSRFWMAETRKHFPKGDIYLCTGGHAPAEHGANFGDQCKLAAEVGGGVRITNEASDYRANFSLTRWVASGGKQYGAYYSFEPAGEVNDKGVVARIYGATTSGAKGLHYYFPNLFGSDEARANFVKWGAQFTQRKPIVEIGVYYPQTHIKLNTNDFLGLVQPLRDRFDFDFVSDEQIRDGGLERYKALVLLHGSTSETDVWKRIADWCDNGGLVVAVTGMGRLRTVEGVDIHDQVLGARTSRKGRSVLGGGRSDSPETRAFIAKTLAAALELSPGTRAMLSGDGEEDGAFVALCEPDELVWLNYTDKPVRRGGIEIPAWSIASTKAR